MFLNVYLAIFHQINTFKEQLLINDISDDDFFNIEIAFPIEKLFLKRSCLVI